MRIAPVLYLLALPAATVMLSADTNAQPRGARRTVRPAVRSGHTTPPPVRAPRSGHTSPSVSRPPSRERTPPPSSVDPRVCASKERLLSSDERRLEQDRANLAGVNAEMDQLRRRLEEMRTRSSQLTRRVADAKVKIERSRRAYQGECRGAENCSLYERSSDDLERRSRPVEEALNKVRTEINDARRSVSGLRRRIDPLRRGYSQQNCARLVAGQTAQSTIDRCSQLFSDWNRLQTELNPHNRHLPALRSRYQRLMAELDSAEQRALKYEDYLGRNCRRSSRLGKVRRYRGMRDKARGLNDALLSLIGEVKSLQAIRIHD